MRMYAIGNALYHNYTMYHDGYHGTLCMCNAYAAHVHHRCCVRAIIDHAHARARANPSAMSFLDSAKATTAEVRLLQAGLRSVY